MTDAGVSSAPSLTGAGRPPMNPLSAEVVGTRLHDLRLGMISAGGDPASITVVGVTKGLGLDAVQAAVGAGLADMGENYARELIDKAPTVTGARWHFLGSVQRNKVSHLAPHVALWQAIDRPVAADAVAARQPGAAVLVEVNLTGDPHRGGCQAAEAPVLVEHCRSRRLRVMGLMGVGPANDPEGSRRCFGNLARLGRSLEVTELSMGMSDDYELAVAQGSTMIRIGRLLFGPRPGSVRARR